MLEHVGRNLRRLRRDRDLTQTQVARLAKISQQHLSAIENGLQPPLALVDRFAHILGVHPNELLRDPVPLQRIPGDAQHQSAVAV